MFGHSKQEVNMPANVLQQLQQCNLQFKKFPINTHKSVLTLWSRQIDLRVPHDMTASK